MSGFFRRGSNKWGKIAVPIFYGLLGFIGGAIGALVYNLAAGIVGGIRFELEGVTPAYSPPLPPEQHLNGKYSV